MIGILLSLGVSLWYGFSHHTEVGNNQTSIATQVQEEASVELQPEPTSPPLLSVDAGLGVAATAQVGNTTQVTSTPTQNQTTTPTPAQVQPSPTAVPVEPTPTSTQVQTQVEVESSVEAKVEKNEPLVQLGGAGGLVNGISLKLGL